MFYTALIPLILIMTKKEVRKQRIKELLLKTLHVICYVLSFLFIVTCIVGGVQSCSKKPQKVNAEEEVNLRLNPRRIVNVDSANVYYFNFVGQTYFSIALTQQYFLSRGNTALNQSYSEAQNPFQVYVDLTGSTGYLVDGNTSYLVDRMNIEFSTYLDVNNRYQYRISSVGFNYNNYTGYLPMLVKNDNTAGSYRYDVTTSYILQIVVSEDSILDNLFYFFYSSADKYSFIFNQQFNYNAPLNTNINGVYGTGSFTFVGPDSAYNIYDVGWFVSNGQLFNQIKIWYFKTGAIDVLFSDGVGRAPSGYYVYAMTEYNNTQTSYGVVVNIHDQIPFKTNDGGYTYYYGNSSTWKNDGYRYITFLEPLSDSLRISINSFNNNNQSYYNGQIYSDGGDVFTLLSLGFSSLADFWAINILPGISIGVLFFLPAVVGVIIIIVHLLRK